MADELGDGGERPASAVFVDVENMALSGGNAPVEFDIGRVMDRVIAMSRPIVRRAYADWGKLRTLRGPLLRLGFDQVQTTYVNMSKNTLDMQMCVDAMETVLTTDTIAMVFLITGDSDFSPLARTLRKHGRRVIGIGWHDKTNDIFRGHCDEFIDYESLPRPPLRPNPAPAPAVRHERPAARPPERRSSGFTMPPQPARPFLHDPRYDDDPTAGDDGPGATQTEDEFSFATASAPRRLPVRDAPIRDPSEIDGALQRLVRDHGPGARLPAGQFIKAIRREFPGFTPLAFGVRTLAEFVAAHPLLHRDESSGPVLVVVLPGVPETDGEPEADGDAPPRARCDDADPADGSAADGDAPPRARCDDADPADGSAAYDTDDPDGPLSTGPNARRLGSAECRDEHTTTADDDPATGGSEGGGRQGWWRR